MNASPRVELRTRNEALEIRGILAIYESQTSATAGIPEQWQTYLADSRFIAEAPGVLYGASPCTDDGRIHYMTGTPNAREHEDEAFETVVLATGEYAVFTVESLPDVRETWGWIFASWLPASGRQERSAPEFEVFQLAADRKATVAPVELWVPLAPESPPPNG